MFEQISKHIFVRPCEYYTDRPNMGLIVGEKRTLLFEAGNSAANVMEIQADIRSLGLPMPDYLVVSHWHWDHTFGMHAWSAPSIASAETNRNLARIMNWAWDDQSMEERVRRKEDIVFCNEMIKREYPDRSQIKIVTADIEFEDQLTIDLGGVVCQLLRSKGPHSSDSVICYVPEDEFVFLGDSNGKDLYGLEWDFDIQKEEELVPTLDALPYDQKLVKDMPYLFVKSSVA